MSSNKSSVILRGLTCSALVLIVAGCHRDFYRGDAGASAFSTTYGNAVASNIELHRAGVTDRSSRGTTTLNGVFQSEVEAFVDFRRDSYEIWPDMMPQFARQAEWLRAHPGASVRVMGRGDRGSVDAADRDLAMRRARAAADYYEILGISADRLVVGIEPDGADAAPVAIAATPAPVAVAPVYAEPVPAVPVTPQPALADLIYVDDPAPEPVYAAADYTISSEPLQPVDVAPVYVETPPLPPVYEAFEATPVYSEPVEFTDYALTEPTYIETPASVPVYAEPIAPVVYAEQSEPIQDFVTEPAANGGYRGALYGGIRLIAFKRPGLDGSRATLQNRRYITDTVEPPADISTGVSLGGEGGG